MIRLIEAKNYRSLKYISQPLGDFHVLVGANATGKTTFLDVVSFLADLVGNGLDYAIEKRTKNYMDLTFGGEGGDIEIIVEMEIPAAQRSKLLPEDRLDRIRYEVWFGLKQETQEHTIYEERVLLINSKFNRKIEVSGTANPQFPQFLDKDTRIVNSRFITHNPIHEGQMLTIHVSEIEFKSIIERLEHVDSIYRTETGPREVSRFKLSKKKSSLGNLPADEEQFPVSTWLKNLLSEGVQMFLLESLNIRHASPPGKGIKLKTDGSNLPWVIEDLKKRDMDAYKNWVEHIRTALPDIQDIITVERQDDRHRYLKIIYDNGIEVPSWMVSDGTLRLLALTLPAYLPDFEGVYLIEEPENGIHPRAIETVFQSLSSVYNAQILLATHSPVILSMVAPKDVLCFAKTPDGVTDIVKGNEHPMLQSWHGTPNLSVLFAAGVLS